jgi:uncharacterized protein (TIGR02300 family)
MANPAWGTKRICQSCGTKYYDLNKSPIHCPKCGAEFNPELILKSRRAKPVDAPKAKVVEAKPKVLDDDIELEALGDDIDIDDETVDEDAFIEDASDLDGDDDLAKPIGDDKE